MLYAPVDVVLSPYDVVQPDLVFVSKERAGILTEKNIQGAPDLLIEILSERTRRVDEGVKLHRYERFGVREYWLVDPERESVRVYRLQEDSSTSSGISSANTSSRHRSFRASLFPSRKSSGSSVKAAPPGRAILRSSCHIGRQSPPYV